MPSWPGDALAWLRAAGASYARLDRQIWNLAWLRAINTVGLSLVMSFVGAYLIVERDIAGVTYGWIALSVNLAQSAAAHWAGRTSDRIGRRRLMLASQLVRAVVVGAIGATVAYRAPVPVIVALMVMNGGLRGCFEPVASALVADLASPGDRVAAFGLQRMGVNLGWAVGPAAGGLLAGAVGYGTVFAIALPFLLLAAWSVSRLQEPPRPRALTEQPISWRRGLAEARRRPDFTLLLLCGFLFSLAHIQQFTTLQTYGMAELGLDKGDLGLVYTVNGLAVLLLQIPAVTLIGRVRAEVAQIGAAVIYLIAFLCIGAASSLGGLCFAIVIMTAGEVLLSPAQQATVAELGDPRRLGRAFGLLGSSQMLGVAFAPVVGGLAYDHLRDRHMLMWGSLAVIPMVLIALYVAFASVRRRVLLREAEARMAGAVVEIIGPELSGPVQR